MSSVCRICLSGNTRLHSLENHLLIDVYEKLFSTKFYAEDTRPRVLCGFCYQKLLKCHTFFQIADRSEKILTHLYDKGLQVTLEYITEVNLGMKSELTVASIQCINIYDNTSNAGSQEIIKYESIPIVDIKEEATTEQDEWVDIGDDTNSQIKTEEDISDLVDDVDKLSYSIDDEETKPDDPKMMIRCNRCNKVFYSKSQLVSHIKNSHFQLKRRQRSCTKQYTENTSMNKDKINHIQKKTFDCRVCGKEFVRKDSLNKHIRTHTVENPFTCDVCDKKYIQKGHLVRHMRIHTKKQPFSCNVCDKPFNSKQYFLIHMRNHTGEKPYVCNLCDKRFKQNPHLISHMRTHTREKPFACKECDKQFTHKRSLDFHFKIHTGEKPFVCNECKKQYKLESDLVRHMRTHTGGMPFACNVCDKQFNLNRDLTRHMRRHTKEKPFACNVCDKKFSLKCNLVTHVRIHA